MGCALQTLCLLPFPVPLARSHLLDAIQSPPKFQHIESSKLLLPPCCC